MLARAQRVRSGTDFRETMRRGRKVSTASAVVYARRNPATRSARFGIIVSRSIGNAVVRNRVKRRMRAVCALSAPQLPRDVVIVIRALPAAAGVDWDTLREQVTDGFRRAVKV